MPYIEIKTNTKIKESVKTDLKAKLGEYITTFPGKSETWLMISFIDGIDMAFSGTSEPCAMVEVKLFGKADRDTCANFASKVSSVIAGALGVLHTRLYLKFEGCETWSFFGQRF